MLEKSYKIQFLRGNEETILVVVGGDLACEYNTQRFSL